MRKLHAGENWAGVEGEGVEKVERLDNEVEERLDERSSEMRRRGGLPSRH